MKRNMLIGLLSFFLLILGEKTFASHAIGADLTYICLGGNNYRFYLTIYRDCYGIAVNPTYTIAGTSTCGGSASVTANLDSTVEIIHTCSSVATACTNINNPVMGVQANYYHGDVVIPSQCNLWTFGLSPALCNRNGAITNLFPSGPSYCLYVEATLNNSAVQCDNSPLFESLPVQFLCANQVQYYIEHAFDFDNDSLVYQMITPHSDPQTDVQYVPGLAATQPVFYISPTAFNSQTGDVQFYADGPQVTVMAMEVSEYRNGILIGSVERDIQLIFENCTNMLPIASGINSSLNYSAHVCADSVLAFTVNTIDGDAAQQTYLTWNNGISGATFSTSGTHRDTGYFSWHPGQMQISPQPYIFTVTVTDSACPSIGVGYYSYAIYIDSCMNTAITPIYGSDNDQFTANYISGSHSLQCKYRLHEAFGATLSIYDFTGRELNTVFLDRRKERKIEYDVHALAPGAYVVNLRTGNGFFKSIRVIIE